MEASSKRCCTSCRPCRFSVRGNIKAGNFRDDSVLACALLLTVPCQRFTPKQHPFFPQSRTHSPLPPEPAALHCPFKALVGQHQGLSHQYCPTAVGTPSHGHFPGPLSLICGRISVFCWLQEDQTTGRWDVSLMRTKDLVLYLGIVLFSVTSQRNALPSFL